MALNGVAPAGLIGRAVPLAFLFAAIAIALISYSFVTLTRYFSHLEHREPQWRVLIIGLATAAIVYTMYKQIWPRPPHPYNVFPYLILAWAVVGAAITFAFPGLTKRIGDGFRRSEGMVEAD
jgi:predicted membrane channel-forming protein YqfA (hemolysin III family)